MVAVREREVAAVARAKGARAVHLPASNQTLGLNVRPRGEHIAAVAAIIACTEAKRLRRQGHHDLASVRSFLDVRDAKTV